MRFRPVFAAALLAALLALPCSVRGQEAADGAIRGTVLDRQFGVPLAGARVTVIERSESRTTGPDGTFLFERVPPGVYTLQGGKPGFERRLVSGVVVVAGRLAEVQIEVSAEVFEMDEMVVTGEDVLAGTEIALLDVRAEAVTVQDAISQDFLSRAGVGDAAGALNLVVGTTVVEGKYASVRGLSDRYTGTTLNGVRIPSADPRKRAVPMDLFPTGTIESVTVTKTFTPDLQGDFSGGGVDVKTRSIPEGRIASVSMSGEHNSLATGEDSFLTYAGGGVDPTGFDRGKRNLPAPAQSPPVASPASVTYPRPPADILERIAIAEAYDRLTRSFSSVMGVRRDAPGANHGFSLLWGNRWDTPRGVFGAVTALSYSRKFDFYRNAENNRAEVQFDPDTGEVNFTLPRRDDSRGLDELLIGALANGVWKIDEDHELSLRFIGNQSAEDEARFQTEDRGILLQNQSLRYTERSLASIQGHGTHKVGTVGLDWLAAWNLTRQNEPDVRFFRNNFDEAAGTAFFEIGSVPDSLKTRRIFRGIRETGDQAALNVSVPFTQWTESEGKVKAGLFLERTDRAYDQRSFYYSFQFSVPGSNTQAQENNLFTSGRIETPGGLWSDFFLSPERIGLSPNTCPPERTAFQDRTCAQPNQLLWYAQRLNADVEYDGAQAVDAAYAMAEVPLSPRVNLVGGARWERTDIRIVPFNERFGRVAVVVLSEDGDERFIDPNVPQEEAVARVEDSALLPSLSAIWEIVPRMKLRGTWSRTLARPTYRELAPVATEEFLQGDSYFGNPDLVISTVTNWDLRWEWLKESGDVLAVSAFAKRIDDPIELISFNTAGGSYIQPVNYERGRIRGGELEARFSLGRFASWLEGLAFGANYSLIDSEVDVPEAERRSLATFGLDQDTRRLQGQPSYVFNLNATWDLERTGTSIGIFYNRVGETLLTGASVGQDGGVPDVLELPVGVVDVSVSQAFHGVKLTLRGRNLTAPERRTVYRIPDGEERTKTRRESARLVAISASYKW